MDKITKCQTCGTDIAASAKACPSCGAKVKKPIVKKWWFWVIIAVVVISIGSAIGGGSDPSSDTPDISHSQQDKGNEGNVSTENSTEAKKDNIMNPGDSVDVNGLVISYESAAKYVSGNQYSQPKSGNIFIALKISVENKSTGDRYISAYDFDCYADGAKAESYWGGEDELSVSNLSSGRKGSGYVYFEVPENAEEIEVEYETDFWSDNKVIFNVDLEG